MNHDMESLKTELANLVEPPKPVRTRWQTNNATVEKLHELCRDNPRGVLQSRDELSGWLAQIDQAGNEQDRAFYLEGWNGTGRFDLDRIGRGTVSAKLVCISVLGNIQPEKLSAYLSARYENDGLIQRFQAISFADPLPYKHVDRPADAGAKERVRAIFHHLAKAEFSRLGATGSEGEIPGIRLSGEAQVTFNEWLIDLEITALAAKEHPLILEHLSKFRSFVPALALINHLVSAAEADIEGETEVSQENMILAIAQAEYFESHARRMYGLVIGGLTASVKLANQILAGHIADGFTVRDVYRNGWSQLKTAEAVEQACQLLTVKSWLKPEHTTTGAQGGRQTIVYRINPKVYQWASSSNN